MMTELNWRSSRNLKLNTRASFLCFALVFMFANMVRAETSLPEPTTEGGYTTSDTCRACHPGPYESWRNSFHRTMTQAIEPNVVLGDFENTILEARGHSSRFEQRGDDYWVDIPDPAWFLDPDPNKVATPPRINVPVVMTTGSHHMQYYWVRRPKTGPVHERHDHGALMSVPWVWLIEDARWIPVQDSFLTPPTKVPEAPLMWNTSCFSCHSVATQPHYQPEEDEFKSQTVELGIACEACHGPADEHVAEFRSPLARYSRYFTGDDEPVEHVVNPARLSSALSRDVCGQCHSFGEPLDLDTHKKTGVAFRPGNNLHETNRVFQLHRTPAEVETIPGPQDNLGGNFWPDGTIRVAGREYNGLMESKCATQGALTCLSCHSMHSYEDTDSQLRRDRQDDATCASCHPAIAKDPTPHTHHAPDSPGSRCMNCHMPRTTYGLFVAMRSHRIDSPNASTPFEGGRPNACNLCHLDQPLAWTSDRLHDWYEQPKADLTKDERTIAASVLWALKGDAAQRSVVGWHMGWEPAHRASGDEWIGAYLSILLADPYVAVRKVAGRSIKTLPGFGNFEYDFYDEPSALAGQRNEAIQRWLKAIATKSTPNGKQVLLNATGEMNQVELNRIFKARDNRAIRISE